MSPRTSKVAAAKTTPARTVAVRPADAFHQVATVVGGGGGYRKRPCKGCPWRVDQVGSFPAEAFRLSAESAYDMSQRLFGCHESGTKKPKTCAGFLLRGADHNLRVRLKRIQGDIGHDVSAGDVELHASYKAMAIANGVAPDDPILQPCRSADD